MARLPVMLLLLSLLIPACGPLRAGGGPTPGDTVAVDRPAPDSTDVLALSAGLNDAGARLFLAAAEGEEGDLLLSPLSIGAAFGMADVGARGAASAGLADLFGYPVTGQDRLSAFNTLLQQVTAQDGPVVALANRQFPDRAFTPDPAFSDAIATWFGAAAQPLPLQADPDGSRDIINGYVAEQTRDLIPELLPPTFLTPDSVLVLVNALYLQADWAMPFGKYPTQATDFTRLDGTTTTVQLMDDRELSGPALAGDGFVAAAKPYEGGQLDLLVVVPDEGRFEEVQQRLAEGLLDTVAADAAEQSVQLLLPRFGSAAHLDLRPLVEDGLGIDGIFSDDYAGIAEGIELTAAVHGADIRVDEIGTVAAAATALGFEESGAGQPDLVVRADRPFLYAIRHQPTGAVLFLGRVMDPQDPGARAAS